MDETVYAREKKTDGKPVVTQKVRMKKKTNKH